jgi:hypothetical protein
MPISARLLLAAGAAMLPFTAFAKEPCPPRDPGAPYPWQTAEVMKGDLWGQFFIQVDAKGRPTGCRVGEHNMDGDTLWMTCEALKEQWRPPEGTAFPTTSKIRMHMRGPRHRQIEEAARKRFFRENPGERPECYPY